MLANIMRLAEPRINHDDNRIGRSRWVASGFAVQHPYRARSFFELLRGWIGVAACLLVGGGAFAADGPASLDSKANCEKPAYPRASLVNEEKGTVAMAFLIAADGRVVESKVEKSSGFKNLDRAALAGLAACKFIPAMRGGKAEQGWAKVEYTWKLE